jgi:hypothetical protein
MAARTGLASQVQVRWQRLLSVLRRARLAAPPSDGVPDPDDEVIAFQCAEYMARAEFNAAMEAWASRP